MKAALEEAIKTALIAIGAGKAEFVVERPALQFGDYATNAALVAAKLLNKNPRDVAEGLKRELEGKIEGVEKIEPAGAGFLNFSLSREAVARAVADIAAEKAEMAAPYQGKVVLVEYTSPNLFKPLHIGNLVGNILGESLARLFEIGGASVKRINYPSDIGLTVAKGVWGLWKHQLDPRDIAQLGRAYAAGNEAYEDGSGKAEIDEINKALYEDSNAEWSGLRKEGIKTSLKHLDGLCERLGTRFDREFFESEAGPRGRNLIERHKGEIFEESEGAVVFRGAHTRVFLTSADLPTYEAKELGLFELKSEAFPDFDISITVTGSEQKDFFKVIFDALEKIFPEKLKGKRLQHLSNGFLRLTSGKMSSRKGNVITGESLLQELQQKARGREDVAVGAIKYAVLRQGSGRDIVFDPEKSLSLEGDSGPYLQYARVRALSLIKEAQKAGITAGTADAPAQASELERILLHFPTALERGAQGFEPHYVTTYLTEVAAAFNSWYASTRLIGGAAPAYGLMLTMAAEKTLAQGLWALGIPLPEEM